MILQAFSGTLFPAMWLAGVTYADENVPAGLKSSAQGLFTAVAFSVGGAVGGFLGALLLESIGGHGMYLVFGTIILAGVTIAEGTRRLFPKSRNLPTLSRSLATNENGKLRFMQHEIDRTPNSHFLEDRAAVTAHDHEVSLDFLGRNDQSLG